MKLSCSTLSWGEIASQSKLAEILRSIKKAGYEAVEVEYRFLPTALKDKPRHVAELVRRAGLEISAVALVDVPAIANFVKSMGTDTSTLCLFEKDLKTAIKKTKRMLASAMEVGVEVAIHPHVRSNVETAAQIDRLFEECRGLSPKICLDTAHLTALGFEIPTFVKKYGKSVKIVHVKDLKSKKSKDQIDFASDFVDIGDGVIDFRETIKALRAVRYAGWLSVEVDMAHSLSPEASAEKNYERLRRILHRRAETWTANGRS